MRFQKLEKVFLIWLPLNVIRIKEKCAVEGGLSETFHVYTKERKPFTFELNLYATII